MFEIWRRLCGLGAIVQIWGSRVNATDFLNRVDAFIEDVYGNMPTAVCDFKVVAGSREMVGLPPAPNFTRQIIAAVHEL